ncbi:MAG: methylated-DNA--[protein]-cysteine S-methyltransferase [Gammaproteobacteria bacterium]|nr:methylated-DNA--[protein]-cysteine S-methyltransferase [Gammaproteobacteria bacterium]
MLHACRRVERGEGDLSLDGIARSLGVSAHALHRQFAARLGISSKSYRQALRLHCLVRRVGRERSTLDATLAAGFESTAAAYATAGGALGVPPGRLRRPLDIGCWMGLSDLGWMLLAATERGICWLAFGDDPAAMRHALREAFPKARFRDDQARLYDWFDQVREFVLLPQTALELPVDVQGTAFQARVWRALRRLPLGATASYGQIARRLGEPGAARAVGAACANNPVALLIPCHRVVASDGRIGGYRWGAERKALLLSRERSARPPKT